MNLTDGLHEFILMMMSYFSVTYWSFPPAHYHFFHTYYFRDGLISSTSSVLFLKVLNLWNWSVSQRNKTWSYFQYWHVVRYFTDYYQVKLVFLNFKFAENRNFLKSRNFLTWWVTAQAPCSKEHTNFLTVLNIDENWGIRNWN